MRKILTIGLFLVLFIFAADETSAKVYVAGSSAQLKVNRVENTADYRVGHHRSRINLWKKNPGKFL
jgi:hypothetical protein